jgi:hypothetical protein
MCCINGFVLLFYICICVLHKYMADNQNVSTDNLNIIVAVFLKLNTCMCACIMGGPQKQALAPRPLKICCASHLF